MRGDVFRAEALGKLVRHALGEPAGVHRDERGAVLFDELHEALVDLGPHFVRHHRFERRLRHLHREIHLAPVAFVDDRAWLTRKEARHLLDRLLGRRQARAQQATAAERCQPFERQRQVGAALVRSQRMDLVEYLKIHRDEQGPPDRKPVDCFALLKGTS